MNADRRETTREPSFEKAPCRGAKDGVQEVESEIPVPLSAVNFEGSVLRNHEPATDFVDGASHDLHTPLNVIIGMCRLLERYSEPLTSKQQDAVHRIERNAQALLKSVNELLRHLRSEHDN